MSILTDMGIPFWLPRHNGVENSVLLPTAPGRLSREIDCLVVCPFGVYVLEVKHWALHISDHEDSSKLKVQRLSGQSESARSAPLHKTISKARELCLNLPRDLP
ncbi:MAG: nuclease-related domain-containing protein [Rhodoferax sp.]